MPQEVPVKLYRTIDRLTVAALMPGLLAQDFSVEITADNHLVLSGPVRGITADVQVFHRLVPGNTSGTAAPRLIEEQRELLLDEWAVGAYRRDLPLPSPVNGRLATLTYGNGVLVVSLPVARRVTPARLSLAPIGIARGERIGSAGHPIRRRSTAEHLQVAHHVL
jgi:HSP20 family protein